MRYRTTAGMKRDKNTVVAENPVVEAAAIDPATISGPAVDIIDVIWK